MGIAGEERLVKEVAADRDQGDRDEPDEQGGLGKVFPQDRARMKMTSSVAR
jgi:hypothetical protein